MNWELARDGYDGRGIPKDFDLFLDLKNVGMIFVKLRRRRKEEDWGSYFVFYSHFKGVVAFKRAVKMV